MTTILIVDDRPINRQFLINLLGYVGYDLKEASDGEEALVQARLNSPDLIITDIAMPVVDGHEFVLNLRAEPELAHIPVIFYTATYRVNEAQILAEKADVFYILSKPTEPEEILRIVALALDGSAPSSKNLHPEPTVEREVGPESSPLPQALIELQAFNQQMTTIIELGQELSLQRDAENLLQLCCRATRNVIGARYAVLDAYEPDLQTRRHHFVSGAETESDSGIESLLSASRTILEQVVNTRKPARLNGSGGPGSVNLPDKHLPSHSLLVVPLMSTIQVYGWLCLVDKISDVDFSSYDERLLLTLASQAIVTYENLELYNRLQQQTVQLQYEVAERKHAERELARSNQDLAEFAHIASHDLKEPLRTVAGFLQLLQRRYNDRLDDDGRRYINLAVDGTKQMQTLIQDLLAYSRIGKNVTPFKLVDFNAVLDQVKLNLTTAIQENEARVTCDPLPSVAADFGQMVQLFQNLVGNAIKFKGAASPKIHISAQKVSREEVGLEPDPVAVDQAASATKPTQGWRFMVRDNGIGLDPKFADRIFMPFKRLHSQARYEGSGVGLAICHKIVQRHKGRIWVKSELGQGSTFFFTLTINSKQENLSS